MDAFTNFPISNANIPELPDVSPVTDTSMFIMERAGTGRINAAALRSYIATSFDSVAALRAASSTAPFCYVKGWGTPSDGGGGLFVWHVADISTADNGVTVVVDAAGHRWVRDTEGQPYNVRWAGAGIGAGSNATAIEAVIAAAGPGGRVDFPPGTYLLDRSVNVPATTGTLAGMQFTGSRDGSVISPAVSMGQLFYVTGTQCIFGGLNFTNVSNLATNGITFLTGNTDANWAAIVQDCMVIGFTVGIQFSGQNYNISNNFFNANTTHLLAAADGMGSIIDGNYMLGGGWGIHLAPGGTQQAEGAMITKNAITPTVANGAGIWIESGLELYIAHNMVDCYAAGSPALYMNTAAGKQISKIKIISNWLGAGANTYSIFCGGTTSDIDMIANTIIPNASHVITAGIALVNTNGYSIVCNNFGATASATPDLSFSGTVNGTILGNRSANTGSNATASLFNDAVSLTAGPVAANSYHFSSTATLSSGAGLPAVAPAGSVWLRTDSASHLWVSSGSAWVAVAGV